MVYVVLFALSTTAFSQIMHYGQRRETYVLSFVAVNYVIASVVTTVVWRSKGLDLGGIQVWPTVVTGFINGVLFFSHIPFVFGAFRMAGVGAATAIGRSGVVLPALVAWYAWGETMTPQRWLALALVPFAMFLLRPPDRSCRRLTVKADAFLLGYLFIGAGILVVHKYADIHFSPGEQEIYKVSLFTTAAVTSVSYVVLRRISCTIRDMRVGMSLGLCNAAALLFVMLGLASVPAVVFYPTSACLSICMNVFASRWLWKETLVAKQLAGVLLTIAIVVLTNL